MCRYASLMYDMPVCVMALFHLCVLFARTPSVAAVLARGARYDGFGRIHLHHGELSDHYPGAAWKDPARRRQDVLRL